MVVGRDCRIESDDVQFAEELAQLKRHGASILIVGAVRNERRLEIGRRLLGETVGGRRRYILVSTTNDGHHLSSLLTDTSPAQRRIVTYGGQTCSVPTAPTTSYQQDIPPIEADTLADLGIGISSAIESFETDAEGLESTDLRISVDSLLPLLEEYNREQVFRFVHLINGRIREDGGLIHYHLPIDRDGAVVPILSSLVDVVVELREQNGLFQERWTLTNGDQCSGWVAVPHQ